MFSWLQWRSRLLTLIAGASMVGAFAPFNYWPLIFPGLIWLILPLQSLSTKQAFYRGLWFYIGFYGAGLSWIHVSIHRFGQAPLFLSVTLTLGLIVLLSLFSSLSFALLNRYFRKLNTKYYFLAALPFCWLVFEWLRSWFLTGFPWLDLGQSQVDGPLAVLAPLLGSSAITLFIIMIAGLIVYSIRTGLYSLKFAAFSWIVLVVSIVILHQIQWVKITDKQLTVSLIQPNIPQEKKWLPEQRRATLNYFTKKTAQLDTQLVIWPEAAIPALADRVVSYLQMIAEHASKKSQTVLTGIPVREDGKIYNAAILMGKGTGKYFKQHLVPFGEFVPLESWLRGLITLFDLPMSSFSSGSDKQPNLQVADWNIAMALCYEIIFQDVVDNQLTNADLIVTLSNDAWFGDSIGPYQHLEIARMRALENGIPVVRATNDGISALIDHQGKIMSKLGKFKEGTLTGTVTAVSGETLYRKLGPHWSFAIILLIPAIMLFFAFYSARRRNND